jgi:hypothetical protein
MSEAAHQVEGVVLCRVGVHRLAVLAGEVGVVELPSSDSPYAGRLFDAAASSPADARLLRHETAAMVVDTLEVHAERLSLFPVPTLLGRVVGGALRGFVLAQGALWPVVSLPALAAHLGVLGSGAPA